MWGGGYNNYGALQNELASDLWIQRNIPGGLNSKVFSVQHLLYHHHHIGSVGRQLDNYFGGNPNPTYGQLYGGYGGYGQQYGHGNYYNYRRC